MKIGINFYPESKNLPIKDLAVAKLDDNNLNFAKSLGVTHIVSWMPFPEKEKYWDFTDLLQLRKFVENHGMELEALENLPPNHYDKILLWKPGREEQIKNISKTIQNMGKAGIKYLGLFFSIVGYWGHSKIGKEGSSYGKRGETSFDYGLIKNAPEVPQGELWGTWKTEDFNPDKTIGQIKKEDMWERLVYFIEKLLPAAERAKVKICLHPADPPAPALRGVGRVLNCVEDFKKLFNLFKSDYLGIEFCQGTFSEMKEVGKDIASVIKIFGKKIFYVHFRNVEGKFPKYRETLLDEGDVDLAEAIKAYRDVGFNGVIIPDHVPFIPGVPNSWHIGMAYSIGYIKSLLNIGSI